MLSSSLRNNAAFQQCIVQLIIYSACKQKYAMFCNGSFPVTAVPRLFGVTAMPQLFGVP